MYMKATVTATLAGANMLIISSLTRGVLSVCLFVCAKSLAVYMKHSLMNLTEASARTLSVTRSRARHRNTKDLIN